MYLTTKKIDRQANKSILIYSLKLDDDDDYKVKKSMAIKAKTKTGT